MPEHGNGRFDSIKNISADPALREAVTGISAPIEDKHQFYIDIQPMMGTA